MFSRTSLRLVTAVATLLILGFCVFGAATLLASDRSQRSKASIPMAELTPVRAIPLRLDTLYLGGYAQGSFEEAVRALASELSAGERLMVGRHLDKIFSDALSGSSLQGGGRLRLAYERAVRPDGTARSVRVLTAEAAVGGRMFTAFFFESAGQPGYYDTFGRSLEGRAWLHPLTEARVTSPFNSQRMHPILKRVLPHLGVDYAATYGAPVRAAGDGGVSFAEVRGGYGKLVEIQHPNGYSSRYAHLSKISDGIRHGSAVRQGDVIGYVGATGLATAPHLHYEIRRHGRPVDPVTASAEDTAIPELTQSLAWSEERERLGDILSRTPRLLQKRPDPL